MKVTTKSSERGDTGGKVGLSWTAGRRSGQERSNGWAEIQHDQGEYQIGRIVFSVCVELLRVLKSDLVELQRRESRELPVNRGWRTLTVLADSSAGRRPQTARYATSFG